MKHNKSSRMTSLAIAAFIAFALPAGAAWAKNDKGDHGEKHGNKHEDRQGGNGKPGKGPHREAVPVGGYFQDGQRVRVREYWGSEYKRGHCPPGLAKKNNGCMPPGQAKKWQAGQPLPRGVTYYSVPQPLVVQLGAPPQGHRYVRVGSDILLVVIGSMLVVDGINGMMN